MAATMIFATSCSNEFEPKTAGETSIVSFTINSPEIGSRAFSDGLTATHLQYAVYDAEGNILPALTVTDAEIHGTTTVTLELTTGNSYNVVFWAAAPNAPYTVDFDAKKMTVDYSAAVSNDENRDAFYKLHTITVNGAQTETVELRRPFAQLNIGTNDYEAAENAGYVPTKSKVTVSNVFDTLNFFDGTVSGGAEVTYDYAALPTGEEFPVEGYDYLAMNYLLVAADKALVEVEFTYADAADNAKTRTVGSVPVQRNYRTNIYGKLLTSSVDATIIIVPEYEEPANNVELVQVATGADLQTAIDNAAEGSTIELSETEDYGTVILGSLKDVTIKGNDEAVVIIKTDANTVLENVTLQNIKFQYTGATYDCGVVINADAQIENLVIEDCTFVGTGAKAGRGISGNNNAATITLSDCTFQDLGYPIYAWGGYESLTVDGCSFENIQSWSIMPQSGFDGDLTVTDNNFTDCVGGLVKAGTLTAGHTFTFTGNTITNSTEHPNRNWFEFNVSNGTSVIENNTMDGQAWTPSAEDGLK